MDNTMTKIKNPRRDWKLFGGAAIRTQTFATREAAIISLESNSEISNKATAMRAVGMDPSVQLVGPAGHFEMVSPK
jgi:hypothetical protein